MVHNYVSTSLITGYLYLSFLSLHFTCLVHSQSFQKTSPTLLQAVMRLNHFFRVRFESESQALRIKVESESSEIFSSQS